MNMHISYLSPPFAPSAFYMKSITPPEITMTQIYVATLPYLWLTFVATLWLPPSPGCPCGWCIWRNKKSSESMVWSSEWKK